MTVEDKTCTNIKMFVPKNLLNLAGEDHLFSRTVSEKIVLSYLCSFGIWENSTLGELLITKKKVPALNHQKWQL